MISAPQILDAGFPWLAKEGGRRGSAGVLPALRAGLMATRTQGLHSRCRLFAMFRPKQGNADQKGSVTGPASFRTISGAGQGIAPPPLLELWHLRWSGFDRTDPILT